MLDLSDLSKAISTALGAVAPSIVAVGSKGHRCSGFVWRPGLIVTADEALADDGRIEVKWHGGEIVEAQLAGRDAATDVALLRVPNAGVPAARLVAHTPAVGSVVLAAGAGLEGPVAAMGIVAAASGAWRSMRGGQIDARVELDLQLRSSAQGGLVLDDTGTAFGMTVLGPRRRTIVIPAATVERVAARLETHGRIGRGYLGLGLQPVDVAGQGGPGAIVVSVDPRGPASSSGVLQGDVIVGWNGAPVRRLQHLQRSLGPDTVGTKIELALQRAGQPHLVTVEVAERPA